MVKINRSIYGRNEGEKERNRKVFDILADDAKTLNL
jgi:hypothetical protein